MSTKNFSFSFPELSNYEVEYYFHQSANMIPERIFPHHAHDTLELYILLEGDVSFAVESSVYKLCPGDAIITKPNEMHHCILNSTSLHNHLCFWFNSSNQFLFGDFTKHDFGENNLISPSEEYKTRLNELYLQLSTATSANDKHKLFYLFLEILDIFRKSMRASSPTLPLPETLVKILADIDINFRSINSLSYFSDKYFISQSTLNRLFRTHLRTSPKSFLETKRLVYSRRLLKKGESVLSACMQSGFTDYSNYIRLFKQRFGVTPKQYRDD